MTNDPVKPHPQTKRSFDQVFENLSDALAMSEKAVKIMRECDPSAPGAHIADMDDLADLPRRVRRAIAFVDNRMRAAK